MLKWIIFLLLITCGLAGCTSGTESKSPTPLENTIGVISTKDELVTEVLKQFSNSIPSYNDYSEYALSQYTIFHNVGLKTPDDIKAFYFYIKISQASSDIEKDTILSDASTYTIYSLEVKPLLEAGDMSSAKNRVKELYEKRIIHSKTGLKYIVNYAKTDGYTFD